MTFENYLSKTHTRESIKTYTYYVDVFLIRYPNALKLSYAEVLEYIKNIQGKADESYKLSANLSAIKRYYDYLIETGKRTDHPCKNIKLHRKKRAIQLQDLFLPNELELLLNRENRYENLELRNKVIISLLIYQALTCSELCRLTTEDVDLESGTVFIKAGKKNAARLLELKPSQILLMQKYLDTYRSRLLNVNTNRFLITIRGTPETTDSINSMIEPLKYLFPERNLNPSTIRQSVIANRLNLQKHSLEDVQLFAGHKWPSTTENYKQKNIDEQREKINLWHPLK